ncbi:MAG: endonuclease/exonuclease/phosphatase family protein [Planctomycetes bacterium]|nr:endonuclease/exonuclease/phosphatase family protein [Planctomycetota bacterium]
MNGRLAAAVALLLGLAFAWQGYRRTPADPTAPLHLVAAERCQPSPRPTLRIATFNIRGGRGRDERHDLARTAASLHGADLVALQEVHGPALFSSTNQADDLGRRLGMASVFVPTERRWWRDSFGNGLLTRIPVSSLQRIPLVGTQDRRYRTALLTRVPWQGTTVQFVMVHGDDRQDHERQLQALCDLFVGLEQPAVLMGDLNTFRGEPLLEDLLRRSDVTAVVDEHWPDRKPLRRVDWIIARGLVALHRECRDLGASDHPVLYAELALPEHCVESRVSRVESQQ